MFESINFAHCITSWGVDAVVVWQDALFVDVGASGVVCLLGGILAGAGLFNPWFPAKHPPPVSLGLGGVPIRIGAAYEIPLPQPHAHCGSQ